VLNSSWILAQGPEAPKRGLPTLYSPTSSSELKPSLAAPMFLLDELIADGRRLSDLGQYDAATSKLRDGLESTIGLDKLRLAAELSCVYVTQGYWKRALETLENALESDSMDPCAWVLRVKMEICLLRVVVTASFAGALKQAAGIWQEFLGLDCVSEQDQLFVCAPRMPNPTKFGSSLNLH